MIFLWLHIFHLKSIWKKKYSCIETKQFLLCYGVDPCHPVNSCCGFGICECAFWGGPFLKELDLLIVVYISRQFEIVLYLRVVFSTYIWFYSPSLVESGFWLWKDCWIFSFCQHCPLPSVLLMQFLAELLTASNLFFSPRFLAVT